MTPKPGEIYGAYDPAGKLRPVIIVSREDLNRGNYVVAVPLTTRHYSSRSRLPNCVAFRKGDYALEDDCVAQADALTLFEKADLDLDTGVLAALDDVAIRSLVHAIGYVISADCEPC